MSDGYEPTQFDMPPVTPGAGQPQVVVPAPGVEPVGPGGPGGPGGGPPEEYGEPDRRAWIIGGLVALIVIVAIILLLAGGDDDGDDVATDTSTSSTSSTSTSSTTSSTTTSSTTSTTVAPTTTTAAPATTAAPTTTEAPPPTLADPADCAADGEGEQQPGLAADTVYAAFLLGDDACAAELMSAPARNELFQKQPQEREFQGCEEVEEGGADCVFFTPGDGNTAIHLFMEFTNGRWQVTDVEETEG